MTTSSWLSCIDIGFIPGVARPRNFGGNEPSKPFTDAHDAAEESSGGCARAAQTPERGVIALLMSTESSDLSFSSLSEPSSSPGFTRRACFLCVDMNIYTSVSRRVTRIYRRLTLRSAPARELNLVAVTTRRFLGSTAPTATSGVSTTATSFGGAVRMAAWPKRTAKMGAGVPIRERGVRGLVGVTGSEGRPFAGVAAVDRLERFKDVLRGPLREEVDLAKGFGRPFRAEAGEVSPLGLAGVSTEVGLVTVASAFVSPSVHCKCRITDFVAHWHYIVCESEV